MVGLPKFQYAVLIEDRSQHPPQRSYITDLSAIPERFINLTDRDRLVMLRQEGWTSLREIKEFHRSVVRAQGLSEETFLRHCATADVSMDGVRESSSAKRSLFIVTVRLGSSIYILKVFNYLLRCKGAKQNVYDVLT